MKKLEYDTKTRVKLEMLLGEGWTIEPAGGSSGEAYIAKTGERKIFLKRNSSPFLAVLSAEGIVPKLLWTKRLENGDVITAQQWIQGRELSSKDMDHPKVAQLLSKIHSSSELLDMFKRIGNQPLTPDNIVEDLQNELLYTNVSHPILQQSLHFLSKERDKVTPPKMVVCHCDMNHNNWMVSQNDDLYLIDWDGASVADPALDLALLLYEYIPRHEWEEWLSFYGVTLDDRLKKRMHWYMVSHTMYTILWEIQQVRWKEANDSLDCLQQLMSETTFYS